MLHKKSECHNWFILNFIWIITQKFKYFIEKASDFKKFVKHVKP